MAIPPSSPRPHPLPLVAPAAPVIPADRHSSAPPLDLLLITSKSDFPDSVRRLSEEAARAGIHFEIILIEELDGSSAIQKLASLHRRIAELADSKKLQSSSATCVSLHGAMRVIPDEMTSEEFVSHPPDLADFVSVIETKGDEEFESESDPTEHRAHVFLACSDSLQFPSVLLIETARHPSKVGDGFQPDYQGPIFISSCEAGHLMDDLEGKDGEVVLLNGKKSGSVDDGDGCMMEVINMMAERRQQNLPPFSGRDYWMQLRNVSGEHIRYVGGTEKDIHKILAAGHCEPVITLRNSQASDQPVRLLEAKLSHGSPKGLQAVFNRYKDGELGTLDADGCLESLASDTYRDREELQEKIQILGKHGIHLPDDADRMTALLEAAIKHANIELLSILVTLDDGGVRRQALLQSAKACIFERPNNAQKLQVLCNEDPGLQSDVIDWLSDSIAAAKNDGKAASFNVSAAPYFAQALFVRSVITLPPPVQSALLRHMKMPIKDKHRSRILNTVVCGDVEAAWNLAKYGAIFILPDTVELKQLNLMPPPVRLPKPLQ